MCAEKNNDKNEKSTVGGCCDGMAEMMKNCCPDGRGDSDCFTNMKEMNDKYYCGQKSDNGAKEESQGCCG